jgi:hypothetical protein
MKELLFCFILFLLYIHCQSYDNHHFYNISNNHHLDYNHNNNNVDNNATKSYYEVLFSRNLQQLKQQEQSSSKRNKNNIFYDIKGRINHSILYRCEFNNTFAKNTLKNEEDNYYIPYTQNDMININNNKDFTIYSFQMDYNVVIDPLGLLKWSRPGMFLFQIDSFKSVKFVNILKLLCYMFLYCYILYLDILWK